jgi:hypothetical protein
VLHDTKNGERRVLALAHWSTPIYESMLRVNFLRSWRHS